MNKYVKQKIREILYHKFHRNPTEAEEANAQNDAMLLVRILVEQMELLEKRIIKLEKK